MPPNRSAVAAIIASTSRLVGDVRLERERVAGAERDRLLRGRQVHVGGADLRALLGEEERRLAAHPAAGARDHAHLAVQTSRHSALRREEDVLDLGVAVERVHPELAAEARLLEAAERRRDAHGRVRVDAEDAGLDRARDAERPRAVARPDRAGEPVRRVVREPDRVGLVVERDQRGDRPEDLLARDAVVVRRLDERRREPEALAVRRLAAEERLAVDERRRPSRGAPPRSAGPSPSRRPRDRRPSRCFVALDQQLGEAVVGAPLDEDARARAAVLAGVVEDGVRRRRGGPLQVGVGEDDVRRTCRRARA